MNRFNACSCSTYYSMACSLQVASLLNSMINMMLLCWMTDGDDAMFLIIARYCQLKSYFHSQHATYVDTYIVLSPLCFINST